MSHLPARLGGRVRSRRRTARPHPSLPPASPGAKMAAGPPPHPRTDRDRGQGGRPGTPRTLEPAPQPSPHALHSTPNGPRSPLCPDPSPGHVRPGTPPTARNYVRVTSHTEPRRAAGTSPACPPPPGSLLLRRSPLKTMAAEAPMTAKKEAYSGPLLASDMSAVGRGRAQRVEAGTRTGRAQQASSRQQARSERSEGCEGDRPVSRCALNTSTAEQNGGRCRVT